MADKIVRSSTEWDPLEEVLVGTLQGAVCVPWEAGIHAVTPHETLDEVRAYHLANGGRVVPERVKAAAERELAEFVSILEGEGIVVRRPTVMDHSRPIMTPMWSQAGGNANANPRDVIAILDDEILEAPMSWRSRYFEYMAYRELINEYFRAGAKWTAAPKPTMADDAYDWNFESGVEYVTTEYEPMFDAADLMRCGRDIFVQRSHVTNELGIEWLRRHCEGRFRIHPVEFDDYRAIHIDATFVALRPGVFMVNPERPLRRVPEILQGSSWKFIEPPPSVHSASAGSGTAYRWLPMNVLSLDANRVIVEASELPFQQFLRAEGFEVIPCPFRNNYRFGGSFHCATVDVRRRGELADYF
jgi:glycine amidinotransferase